MTVDAAKKNEIVVDGYTPNPKQLEFHQALLTARFACYLGGYGSGKTTAGIWQSFRLGFKYPGIKILVGRKTYRELEDTTKAAYMEALIEHQIPFKEVKSDDLIIVLPGTEGEFTLMFRALDDILKLGSLEIGAFHIDEAYEVEEQFFKVLKGRLRQKLKHPGFRRLGYLTTNPPNKDHWIFDWFVTRKDENHVAVHSTTYDNKEHLPEEYIEDLESSYDEAWKRRFLLGQFGFLVEGTAVYQSFKDELHLGTFDWRPDAPMIRTWDFGFHRPAVLFSQTDEDGRRLYVLREIMGKDEHLAHFRDRVLVKSAEWFPDAYWHDYCDVAGTQKNDRGEKTSVEILNEAGVFPRYRRFDILKTVDMVNKKLTTLYSDGKPMLRIDSRFCPILVDGLRGGYYFVKPRDGRGMENEEPCKDGYYEHLQDCFRYTVAHIFQNETLDKYRGLNITGPRWGRV